MATKATSFRLAEQIHQRLRDRADEEGTSVRALLEELIDEGITAREHPGIIHRGRPGHRRAGVAGGPDVWEIVEAFGRTDGDPEERIEAVAEWIDIHPRRVRLALEYAATHAEEIDALVEANRRAAREAEQAAEARGRYLTS